MQFTFGNLARPALLTSILLGGLAIATAQEPAQTTPPAADNTKVNERGQNPNESTADQQKNNRSDVETAKQIRQSLMNDKSLSTYAHNVKIISQNGMVTLKGPVRSEQEKHTIEMKATEVAGEGNVTSELEVQPKK